MCNVPLDITPTKTIVSRCFLVFLARNLPKNTSWFDLDGVDPGTWLMEGVSRFPLITCQGLLLRIQSAAYVSYLPMIRQTFLRLQARLLIGCKSLATYICFFQIERVKQSILRRSFQSVRLSLNSKCACKPGT